MNDRELTAIERAALVTRRLCRGERLTNQQIVELCGYTDRASAYYLMMGVARTVPVTFVAGNWAIVEEQI